MRVGVAGFMHESNTFNPLHADRSAFAAQCLAWGSAWTEEWSHAHHEVGGFLEGLQGHGHEAVPIVMAWATPSGPVTDDVFDEVVDGIISALQKQPVDGLLLALHGAMVTDAHLDADAEVLRRLRTALGPDFPLVVTFDLHGNLTQDVIDHTNAVVAYRTNPHVDQRQCGLRAASLMDRVLRKQVRPCQALAKPPVIISLAVQDTSLPPLQPFMQRLRALEDDPSVLAGSFVLGFPYADVPHMGPAIVIVTDDDPNLARTLADDFSEQVWAERERLTARLPEAAEAVAQALKADRRPAILVDFGDNVGGGSAGDGTVIIHELLRQQTTHFVICLFAPDAVQECVKAGIGATLTMTVGGQVDRLHGDPVEITGTVRLLHDGVYTEPEVRHGGRRINRMGLTALVETADHGLIVLNSLRHPPFSLGQLTCLGIDPSRQNILVVKAAIAYKAAYGPLKGTMIEVDTPGLTAVNPARLPYRRLRPMYPLAKDFGLRNQLDSGAVES